MIESNSRSVLDAPPEPVIGLADGETRWRRMTVVVLLRRLPVIASEAKQSISRLKERIVGWAERSDTHRLTTGIDGCRCETGQDLIKFGEGRYDSA